LLQSCQRSRYKRVIFNKADLVKLIRLSIGIALLIALSAFAAFLLRLNAHMSKSFWPNFLGVLAFVLCLTVVGILQARENAKTDEGRISELLLQFPGPVTFCSSFSSRWIVVAVGLATTAAACVAVGVICFFGWHMPHPQREGLLIMLPCSAFCLAGVRRAIIQLRSGSLTLDRTGFELVGFRHARYLWKDVGDFRREAGGKFEGVGFRVRPPDDDPEALLNLRFTGGRDVWLPDNYGFYLRDLATLLAAWHSRATDTKSP
jgi:hypothetical protein